MNGGPPDSSLEEYVPPVEALAGVDEVVECTNGLLNRGFAIRSVCVKEVHVLQSEAVQGGGCALDDVLAG